MCNIFCNIRKKFMIFFVSQVFNLSLMDFVPELTRAYQKRKKWRDVQRVSMCLTCFGKFYQKQDMKQKLKIVLNMYVAVQERYPISQTKNNTKQICNFLLFLYRMSMSFKKFTILLHFLRIIRHFVMFAQPSFGTPLLTLHLRIHMLANCHL